MFRLAHLNRSTLVTLGGLLVGIAGLVVQWIADPAKFSGAEGTYGVSFPPGIIFILVFGLLTLFTARWWWHQAFAALIAFWIVGVGAIAGKFAPNLLSHNPGTVAGNVVMAIGLGLAFVSGLLGMARARRDRRTARDRRPSTT